MKAFREHKGIAVPLDRNNVDTDQIIPKQFLKRIERTGYGEFLFYDWRFMSDGKPNREFVLNQPQYAGASILIAGRNFGCGSSREHAAWALAQYGFRAILAPSFADIFTTNAGNNGILLVTLPEPQIEDLQERARAAGYELKVSLLDNTIIDAQGFSSKFKIPEFRRTCLLEGLDEIGITLKHEDKIAAYERRMA
ncbi:MAG TPA: 3-isopropylmalate dehydratase small subunit [Terriglobales bacterium]|nr:3-isopropylmalate dehydratase small subunit [Terriglobales bacterium]